MATIAQPLPGYGRDDRFFLAAAVAMGLTVVAGFSLQLAMGRSTFSAPPLVHLHAVVFFGWVALFVLQNVLVTRGSMHVHRLLGWTACLWVAFLVPLGIYTTVTMVRRGAAPFFFEPAYFLVMNSLAVLCFGGFFVAAIVNRRRTEWHRRLHYCGMAVLIAPAFGRLLPMPLLIPYAGWAVFAAVMIFPLVGILHDARQHKRVHPAWWWGIAAMLAVQTAMSMVAFSPMGLAIYEAVTRGYPGARVAPHEFPPPPQGPLITGGRAAI